MAAAVTGTMKQTMPNLISNAADAVGVNGNILVSLKCTEKKDEGAMAHIAVEDDGPGIS
jgi:signal transduction histidine kinase